MPSLNSTSLVLLSEPPPRTGEDWTQLNSGDETSASPLDGNLLLLPHLWSPQP